MYTALYSTSQALASYLKAQLDTTTGLGYGTGGTRVVALNSPQDLRNDVKQEGLSVWLYRIERDDQRLNRPDELLPGNLLKSPPLPLRLHYLMTPVTFKPAGAAAPDIDQSILGRVIQAFHTKSIFSGSDFDSTLLEGTPAELHVRLETLTLDELSRVWEALENSFTLAISYEVAVVNVDAALQPVRVSPVLIAMPEVAIIEEEA